MDRGLHLKCISRWEAATELWELTAGSNTFFHALFRPALGSPQCQLLPHWHPAESVVAAAQRPRWEEGPDLHSLLSALPFPVL